MKGGSEPELDDIKLQVAVANRVLALSGLGTGVLATFGHASMRLSSQPDRFAVRGRGYAIDVLARMRPEDMIICDLDGFKISGPPEVTPCFEVKMHSCIYKARPDVQAVVHVHPRYVVVMSILQTRILPMCTAGIRLVRKPLPIYRHAKIVLTEEEGREVVAELQDANAIILRGHGAATVGTSLADADHAFA